MMPGSMRRSPATLALALAFALPACSDDTSGYDEEEYWEGIDTPASGHDPLATCPTDAPTLGIPGQSATDQLELTWTSNGVESFVDDYLYFVIPNDILSLLIAVEHGSEYTALNGMYIDGETFIDLPNAIGEPPFYHWPVGAAAVTMPISMQTLPRGGCLAIDPVVYADVGGEKTGTLHIVTRRDGAGPSVIDVEVFVVGDTRIDQTDVMAALTHMGDLYAGGGAAGIGDVSFSTLDWPETYVDAEGPSADELRAAVGGESQSLKVLMVQDFNEVGTLGIAAGIPGPNGVSGTVASAVMVSVDTHLDYDGETLLTDLMGETLAHEIGHQLGLFHTTEDTGLEFDPIDDTPECGIESDLDGDGVVYAEECTAADGRNFMFWTSAEEFGQYEVSAIQAMVIRDSVIARPQ
jgi:hypothetical protein